MLKKLRMKRYKYFATATTQALLRQLFMSELYLKLLMQKLNQISWRITGLGFPVWAAERGGAKHSVLCQYAFPNTRGGLLVITALKCETDEDMCSASNSKTETWVPVTEGSNNHTLPPLQDAPELLNPTGWTAGCQPRFLTWRSYNNHD